MKKVFISILFISFTLFCSCTEKIGTPIYDSSGSTNPIGSFLNYYSTSNTIGVVRSNTGYYFLIDSNANVLPPDCFYSVTYTPERTSPLDECTSNDTLGCQFSVPSISNKINETTTCSSYAKMKLPWTFFLPDNTGNYKALVVEKSLYSQALTIDTGYSVWLYDKENPYLYNTPPLQGPRDTTGYIAYLGSSASDVGINIESDTGKPNYVAPITYQNGQHVFADLPKKED